MNTGAQTFKCGDKLYHYLLGWVVFDGYEDGYPVVFHNGGLISTKGIKGPLSFTHYESRTEIFYDGVTTERPKVLKGFNKEPRVHGELYMVIRNGFKFLATYEFVDGCGFWNLKGLRTSEYTEEQPEDLTMKLDNLIYQ